MFCLSQLIIEAFRNCLLFVPWSICSLFQEDLGELVCIKQ